MTVATNATEMVRIVCRKDGRGLRVQAWSRRPDSVSWRCTREKIRWTMRGALRVAKRWPGPLTVEPHYRRERSAL